MMIDVYWCVDGVIIKLSSLALRLLLRDTSARKNTTVDMSPRSDPSDVVISSRQCRSICVYYVDNFPLCSDDILAAVICRVADS